MSYSLLTDSRMGLILSCTVIPYVCNTLMSIVLFVLGKRVKSGSEIMRDTRIIPCVACVEWTPCLGVEGGRALGAGVECGGSGGVGGYA